MSLLTRRHDPDEYDGHDVHDDGDGVLDEVVDGVDGVGDSAESAEDAEDEDGGWWIFNCSRREVVELLVVTVVIVVVSAALGTGLYQLFGRPDREEWARPGETSPAVAHSHQAQESASASPTASLSAEEQALREAALNTPKPERPAGMDEFTVEGAAATAEYYLSLLPYIHATGDLTVWESMSADTCVFCQSVGDRVTELHSSGGWADAWQQEQHATTYGIYEPDPTIYVVHVHVTNSETFDHAADGTVTRYGPTDRVVKLQLHWTGENWTVEKGGYQ